MFQFIVCSWVSREIICGGFGFFLNNWSISLVTPYSVFDEMADYVIRLWILYNFKQCKSYVFIDGFTAIDGTNVGTDSKALSKVISNSTKERWQRVRQRVRQGMKVRWCSNGRSGDNISLLSRRVDRVDIFVNTTSVHQNSKKKREKVLCRDSQVE